MAAAEFRWSSMHSADITTNLESAQVLSVQMAWHKGWHATTNGRPTPMRRDAIGLMYIDPDISGPCIVEIVYDRGGLSHAASADLILIALLLASTAFLAILK